jgi:DNA-binding NarL/FixJ family response regulator
MGKVPAGDPRKAGGASAPPAECVRVVVVGTDTPARRRLRALMEVAPGLDVVAEVAYGEQAAEMVLKHRPDLLLLCGEAMRAVFDPAGQNPRPQTHDAPGPLTWSANGNNGHGPGVDLDLTRREREVMGLIAAGLSNRQIADVLVLTQKTVKNHICRIYQRIGVHERSEAVSRWRDCLDTKAR